MKEILLGKNADGKPLYLTPEMRKTSHMHVIGGTRTGKSKFLEWMMRKDIREGHGFALIDWHGTLYHDILRYCAHLDVGVFKDFRRIILLDPSKPDFITGFNPFMERGEDVSTQVNRRIDATVRPWGGSDTNEMPTFERTARVLFTFMAETGQTLPNAADLLDPEHRSLRDYAIRVVTDEYTRSQLRRFQTIKTLNDWEKKVLSAENRLSRFIGAKGVRRFMGLAQGNLDLMDIMDSGKILLVNLGDSGFLDRKAALVFASLLVYEFKHTALRRALRARERGRETPSLYPLYLDEFQNYITEDLAEALDQVLKGGLHVVLAHQHLGHFADNPKLKKSVFTNARIRAVFGGLDYEDARVLGNEMFLPDLNTRQIKKAYYHTIHLYREETRTVRSHSTTRGSSGTHGSSSGRGSASSIPAQGLGAPPAVEGWFSQSASNSTNAAETQSEGETTAESTFPVWVPIPVQELGSEAEWNREEKLSKIAEILKCQQKQHCFIKLDTEDTQPLWVPDVKDPGLSPEFLLEYQREVYKQQGALPAADVDRLLEESHRKFLTAASAAIDITAHESEPEPHTSGTKTSMDSESPWSRVKVDRVGAAATSTTESSAQGSRGPRTNLEKHAKVASILRTYSKDWRTSDSELSAICKQLDKERVPPSKQWAERRDPPASTWETAFGLYPDLVVKAIEYSIEVAESKGL